ncbi:SDR family NAD(P)-dependent oxidoreductase [Pseudonocardia kunmingensis]|uniref:3-oxoacyl-[acyl-carrier protein] reductase n=1 Tax=Pseudonocardia kunmingensis TaxID=630975 RepID=A0A543D0D2_9PSEU|nr:3-oxoacyl-ACP reductase FabG [Pseudonocardia kunmingensis]TQM02810.1 3-oxoacyl-[acyl-carrier protein] reductase [Pseudonocardia kunmingensis]
MGTPTLQDRVAVVTGAAQGIGLAVAEAYAGEGARVAVVDIDEDGATEAAARIRRSGGTAIGVGCDVSRRADVDAAAARVAAEIGTITILVSNAGITRPAMLWKMTDEQWDSVLAVHVNGSFYWLQAVTPGMREAKQGNIIFTTSAAGIQGTIGQINYATAKAGLMGMARSAARELATDGIIVNAVAPAAATPMTETIRTDERFRSTYLDTIPLGRWAEPEELSGVYVFLASPAASYFTGQTMSVDGGRVMVR